MKSDKTLADHAEDWMRDNSFEVPARNTDEWRELYEKWIDFAFSS